MGALTIVAKYLILANMEVQGIVDKSDIVGAIFSQTEGLLGSDLDLRDLQMSGKIGRIEVEVEHKGDKTIAKIYIPSNLDRYETALIAAMIETVDKVGPYNAKVSIVDIRDLREEKRRKVFERAKELVKKIKYETIPDTKELIEKFLQEVREAEIIKYGPEGLPAGPDVDKSDTIIVVEGRADVLNLLRHGYRNVIAVEGASTGIPKTIIELSKKKTVIAFVDGDRGGEMLLRELLKVADIDYVARAPQGKEVEQLSAKEIAKALRSKVTVEEYLLSLKPEEKKTIEESKQVIQQVPTIPTAQPIQQQVVTQEQVIPQVVKEEVKIEQKAEVMLPINIPEKVFETIKSLSGTLEAIIYDENWNEIKRIPVRDLIDVLNQIQNAYAIIFDGVCTQRLVDLASSKGVKILVMPRIGNVVKIPTNITLITIDELLKAKSSS